MLCSLIEYDMIPFHFQTAQKNSSSLLSSVRQTMFCMFAIKVAHSEQVKRDFLQSSSNSGNCFLF